MPRSVLKFATPLLATMTVMATAHQSMAQTLLEHWAYLNSHGFVSIDEFREAPQGRLNAPKHPDADIAEVWELVDDKSCTIRARWLARGFTEYFYLSHAFRRRPVLQRQDGIIFITLMGNEAVRCVEQRGERKCYRSMQLRAYGYDTFLNFELALDNIYRVYCTPYE